MCRVLCRPPIGLINRGNAMNMLVSLFNKNSPLGMVQNSILPKGICALGGDPAFGSMGGGSGLGPLINMAPWLGMGGALGGAAPLGAFLGGGGAADLASASAAQQTAASAAGSAKGALHVSNTAMNNLVVEGAHQRATAASRAEVLGGASAAGMAGGPSTAVLIFMMGLALAKFSGLMVKDQADRTQRNMEEAESIMNQLKDLRAQSSAMQKDVDSLNNQKAMAVTAATAAGQAGCPGGGALAGQAAAIPFDTAIADVSAQKRVVDDTVKDKEARLRHLGDLSQADMQNFKFWDNLHNQAWQLIDAAMDAKKQTVNATIQGIGR